MTAADRDRAYARAAALSPKSAVPHWVYASRVIGEVRLDRRELNAVYGEDTYGAKSARLDPEQEALAAKVDQALYRAGERDSANAAVDYLRAYLALAEHRDTDAMTLLRSATEKHGWSLYHHDLEAAVSETLRRALPRLEASQFAREWGSGSETALLELSEVLTGMSMLAARHGDHKRGIFLRQTLAHMARLMSSNAYGLIGATAAITVAAMASGWDPKQPVPAAARGREELNTEGETGAAISVYLRQHGRPDLADWFWQSGREMRPAHDRVKQLQAVEAREYADYPRMAAILGHLSVALAGALGLLLLLGLGALVMKPSRRPVIPIQWPAWRWVLVVALCSAVVFLVGLVWTGAQLSSHVRTIRELSGLFKELGVNEYRVGLGERPWGAYSVVIGLPAILISLFVIVVAYRHRLEEKRAGLMGYYLGTLLSLLLPLTAVLSLACLLLAVPTAQAAGILAERNQAIIERGEVAYYGLKLLPP